jgi:acetyltransferase-like isoleucine patch superfamily enzyme
VVVKPTFRCDYGTPIAGSVVTRELPAGVVAFGAPAKVDRTIGLADRVQVPDH